MGPLQTAGDTEGPRGHQQPYTVDTYGSPVCNRRKLKDLKELLLHSSDQKWQRWEDTAMKVVLVKVKIKRVPEEFLWKGQMNNEYSHQQRSMYGVLVVALVMRWMVKSK